MGKENQKEKDLRKAKKRMNPSGNRTREIARKVSDLEDAFQDYIKSDNIWVADYTDKLRVRIENHDEFAQAVKYINRAIENAQEDS